MICSLALDLGKLVLKALASQSHCHQKEGDGGPGPSGHCPWVPPSLAGFPQAPAWSRLILGRPRTCSQLPPPSWGSQPRLAAQDSHLGALETYRCLGRRPTQLHGPPQGSFLHRFCLKLPAEFTTQPRPQNC